MRKHCEAENRHVDIRFFRERPYWLRRDDGVTIEGIGALTNPLEEEKV